MFILGAILYFVLRQILVVNADYFLGPLVATFWRHSREYIDKHRVGHNTLSAMDCPDCLPDLMNTRN